jgi:hypothetical protein
MPETLSNADLRTALVVLCDAPDLGLLPPHYRLFLAQALHVYHLACLEGRRLALFDLLGRIRRLRAADGLAAQARRALEGRRN